MLSIIAAFFGLSGLYVLLEAPFVAVVQIIIYAGAIMVLFLFTVMLLNVPREDAAEWDRIASALPARGRCASAACWRVLLALQLGWALSRTTGLARRRRRGRSRRCRRVRQLGRVLFTDYMFAFEVTSILIIAAMVGAVVLARQEGELTMVRIGHYLMLSGLLFAIGTAGVFLRRNLITLLLSVEIMLNAVNLAFVAFGRQFGTVDGQIITFFVMTVAAAEAAVGLALVIALFRHRESLNPEAFTNLKW